MNENETDLSISVYEESFNWDNLLELLECPVCKDYMVHPIKQCIGGHSMCSNCFDCLNKCPVCRAPRATWNSLISQILPEYLYIPCKYRDQGCTYKRRGYKIKYHESFCQYSRRDCPMKASNNCAWQGCFKDVLQHCVQEHSDVTLYKGHQITCRNFAEIKNSTGVILFVIIYADESLFRLALKYSKSTDQIKWSCSYYGYKNLANRYTYKMIVLSPHEEPSLEWTQLCSPFFEDDRIFRKKYSVKTSYSELSQRRNDNGDLCFYINVTARDKTKDFVDQCLELIQ